MLAVPATSSLLPARSITTESDPRPGRAAAGRNLELVAERAVSSNRSARPVESRRRGRTAGALVDLELEVVASSVRKSMPSRLASAMSALTAIQLRGSGVAGGDPAPRGRGTAGLRRAITTVASRRRTRSRWRRSQVGRQVDRGQARAVEVDGVVAVEVDVDGRCSKENPTEPLTNPKCRARRAVGTRHLAGEVDACSSSATSSSGSMTGLTEGAVPSRSSASSSRARQGGRRAGATVELDAQERVTELEVVDSHELDAGQLGAKRHPRARIRRGQRADTSAASP